MRINEAEAEVARFNAMYEEYVKNPETTKMRMFYETMEDVLPGMKIVIDNGSGVDIAAGFFFRRLENRRRYK